MKNRRPHSLVLVISSLSTQKHYTEISTSSHGSVDYWHTARTCTTLSGTCTKYRARALIAALRARSCVRSMSLFSFGFTTAVADKRLPSYIPEQRESGLGREEHDSVTAAVEDLANPAAKEIKCGKYAKYSDEQRAQIGKYACEHGNTKVTSCVDLYL